MLYYTFYGGWQDKDAMNLRILQIIYDVLITKSCVYLKCNSKYMYETHYLLHPHSVCYVDPQTYSNAAF